MLTGKYTKETTLTEKQKKHPLFKKDTYFKNLEKVDQLREVAANKNVEVGQLVLAWYLTRNSIDAIIPGAKTPEQILSNIQSGDVQLTEAEVNKIDAIFQP